ncbi:cysteine--tRNA ligase [archaeon]|nr:cysteine--tRNA ligase [archaeon]|tara:strand:- start:3480 stop:4865 length:1386 start_codon:yes stop_codon:yes gene_type:complete
MPLKLYNTLTRKKEIFKPIKKNSVGLYTCGPTVYNYAHIGNLRTYIFEDILKRVLLYNKYKVKHVMNITDVGHLTSDSDTGQDKIEKASKKENKTAWQIAKFYTKAFLEDTKKLNILKPDITCKATDYIKEQIDLIKILEEKGYTYEIEDGIYFNTSKLKDYGKLAKLKIEELKEGARVDVVKGKKHHADFALWKFSKERRQMEWPSKYGIGFPGWHIECSAMSMKYLGETFDIHCGGIDHIPVHHTNEIAQTEAATGKKFVNYWLHGNFIVLKDDIKMAKSGENFITLKALEDQGYTPEDYRYLTLTANYRKPIMFSEEALEGAKNSLDKLTTKILEIKATTNESNGKTDKYEKLFEKAINDDLNTPKALAILWDLIKDQKVNNKTKYDLILNFDKIFGLNLKNIKKSLIPQEIKDLADKREKARKENNWDLADTIRDKITKKGYSIEDSNSGYKITKNV